MTLPTGWSSVPLLDIVDLQDSKRIPLNAQQRAAMPGNFPYYGANGQVGTVGDYLFDGPHILLAEDGGFFDQPERGVAYEVDGKFWVNNHAHIMNVETGVSQRYLVRLLNTLRWLDYVSGTTRLKLTQGGMQRISLPMPPAPEQRRIVAKVDALSARLARSRADLDRVQELVAKLRQTALSRAFCGELSTHWRAREGSSKSEWRTCPLSDIADVQGGIQVGKKRPTDATLVEVPYLRVANVQRGWLRLNEIKSLAVTAEERDRLLLKDGDILMNEGGDRDKLGRGWVWREEVQGCIHQNHVFRVRLKDPHFPPEFVSHYANEFGQQYFIDQGTQTTNLASISKRRVMALPVPVPPVAEAKEIARLITAAFARADRLEAEAVRARALLDRLEAAILAKAFRGELVPQDPNDEPASVLLDRIRAERAAAPKPKRGRARKAVG